MLCFRYEQEINKRNDAENEFVMLKKVQYADYDRYLFSECVHEEWCVQRPFKHCYKHWCKKQHVLRKFMFLLTLQDVDSGYLDKVNLDESVTSLADELKFLKALYDTVHKHFLKVFFKIQLS